jgi:translation elongation factor EF-1beta
MNRNEAKIIRKLLEEKVSDALKGDNYAIEIKGATFNDHTVDFKITVSPTDIDIKAAKFKDECRLFDLAEEDYRAELTVKGKKYALVGFNLRAAKLPLVFEDEEGSTWRFPEEAKERMVRV